MIWLLVLSVHAAYTVRSADALRQAVKGMRRGSVLKIASDKPFDITEPIEITVPRLTIQGGTFNCLTDAACFTSSVSVSLSNGNFIQKEGLSGPVLEFTGGQPTAQLGGSMSIDVQVLVALKDCNVNGGNAQASITAKNVHSLSISGGSIASNGQHAVRAIGVDHLVVDKTVSVQSLSGSLKHQKLQESGVPMRIRTNPALPPLSLREYGSSAFAIYGVTELTLNGLKFEGPWDNAVFATVKQSASINDTSAAALRSSFMTIIPLSTGVSVTATLLTCGAGSMFEPFRALDNGAPITLNVDGIYVNAPFPSHAFDEPVFTQSCMSGDPCNSALFDVDCAQVASICSGPVLRSSIKNVMWNNVQMRTWSVCNDLNTKNAGGEW